METSLMSASKTTSRSASGKGDAEDAPKMTVDEVQNSPANEKKRRSVSNGHCCVDPPLKRNRDDGFLGSDNGSNPCPIPDGATPSNSREDALVARSKLLDSTYGFHSTMTSQEMLEVMLAMDNKTFCACSLESATLVVDHVAALVERDSSMEIKCKTLEKQLSDAAEAALQYEKEKEMLQKEQAKLMRKLEDTEANNKALRYMLNDLIGSEEAPGKAIVRARDGASKKAVEDYLASSEYAELLKKSEVKIRAQVFEEVMGYFKQVTFNDIFGDRASSSTAQAEK